MCDPCDTCRHWRSFAHGLSGQCRVKAPSADDHGAGVWPITQANDFCGQHEPEPIEIPRLPLSERARA